MRLPDIFQFAKRAAMGNPLRTSLLILAMSIGVAAVVVLTALGDGARRYVVDQFSALGTNLVFVLPGRSETGGFSPGNAVTNTVRDLTIADSEHLTRGRYIKRVAPLTLGTSEMNVNGKLRELMVAGTVPEYIAIRGLKVAQGRFLSVADWQRGPTEAVIGAKIRDELFGVDSAVGQRVRIGDRRFRIVGVMEKSGVGFGSNTDELVFIPVSQAQAMFNSNTLFRVLIEANNREAIDLAKEEVAKIIRERHEGEEDVTVITQDSVLSSFDKLFGALTFGIAGIAVISLAVAGILVMNVMLVSVTQRTAEIGLLKALGASESTIRAVFLLEAAILSFLGALIGFLIGQLGAFILRVLYPVFPAYPPLWAVLAGVGIALLTGLLFSLLPARRAALLNPVESLAKH